MFSSIVDDLAEDEHVNKADISQNSRETLSFSILMYAPAVFAHEIRLLILN